jgi:hypothetical protein
VNKYHRSLEACTSYIYTSASQSSRMKNQHMESFHKLLVQNHGRELELLLPSNEQKGKHIVQKHLLGRSYMYTTNQGLVTSDMQMLQNVLELGNILNCTALNP